MSRSRAGGSPYEGGPHARVLGFLFAAFRHLFLDRGAIHLDLPLYLESEERETGAFPDLLVALGRPARPRDAYRIWEEQGPPDLVFDVTTPSIAVKERKASRVQYMMFGVPEIYAFDPLDGVLQLWRRSGPSHRRLQRERGGRLVSDRLGLEFEIVTEKTPGGTDYWGLRVARGERRIVPAVDGGVAEAPPGADEAG